MSGGPCPCIPDKIRTLLCVEENHVTETTCVGCGNEFDISNTRGAQTYLYGCAHVPRRVHFLTACFCANGTCHQQFLKRMDEQNLSRYLGMTPCLIDHMDNGFLNDLATSYCKTHVRTSETCAGCRLPELAGKEHSFKVCSGCRYVRYCSQECHQNDWPEHRTFCKAKARANAKARPRTTKGHSFPSCQCFNDYVKHMHYAAEHGMCSFMECTNPIVGPIQFGLYMTECDLPNQSGKNMHFLPEKFCSSKCAKRGRTDPRQYKSVF
jgi:hypothetical protein